MSVTLSSKTPVARKEHVCDWCGEKILKGERYSRWTGVHCCDFQSSAMHSECAAACLREMRESAYEYEYSPYEHVRGSTCERGCRCELHSRGKDRD